MFRVAGFDNLAGGATLTRCDEPRVPPRRNLRPGSQRRRASDLTIVLSPGGGAYIDGARHEAPAIRQRQVEA
jgi:hypothetical protein